MTGYLLCRGEAVSEAAGPGVIVLQGCVHLWMDTVSPSCRSPSLDLSIGGKRSCLAYSKSAWGFPSLQRFAYLTVHRDGANLWIRWCLLNKECEKKENWGKCCLGEGSDPGWEKGAAQFCHQIGDLCELLKMEQPGTDRCGLLYEGPAREPPSGL